MNLAGIFDLQAVPGAGIVVDLGMTQVAVEVGGDGGEFGHGRGARCGSDQ